METTVLAYAKINLYLDVVGKRADGYHDIESIMQTVSLADIVTVEIKKGIERITQEFIGSDLPCDEINLCYKAAKAYLDYFGDRNCHIHIRVEKNIPEAAGLAGGSADAAAVIRALDKAFCRESDMSTLCEIGLKVGSDVAFCIVGGTAAVSGRGERVEKIRQLPEYTVLVVKSDRESVSTKEAYSRIDEKAVSVPHKYTFEEYKNAVEYAEKGIIENGVYNIFEEVMKNELSHTQELIKAMKKSGALCALMSGSGPSVFGFYTDEATANSAMERIKKEMDGIFAAVCKTV